MTLTTRAAASSMTLVTNETKILSLLWFLPPELSNDVAVKYLLPTRTTTSLMATVDSLMS